MPWRSYMLMLWCKWRVNSINQSPAEHFNPLTERLLKHESFRSMCCFFFHCLSQDLEQYIVNMIDHTGVWIEASAQPVVRGWYEAALVPLGYKKLFTEGPNEEVAGFTDNGKSCDFWVLSAESKPTITFHFAFKAKGTLTSACHRLIGTANFSDL